jgi:hypothetical protein
VSRPGTLVWFARHEFRLAWRDWLWMATAGGHTKIRTVAIALLVFVAVMHLIAYGMVSRYAGLAVHPDKAALVAITASALLSSSLMLSQAMESVTCAFYTRSDLDPDVVAGRDLRRGVFFDRLGRRSRTRRGRNLDRGDPRDHCRRDLGGHPPRPPSIRKRSLFCNMLIKG